MVHSMTIRCTQYSHTRRAKLTCVPAARARSRLALVILSSSLRMRQTSDATGTVAVGTRNAAASDITDHPIPRSQRISAPDSLNTTPIASNATMG